MSAGGEKTASFKEEPDDFVLLRGENRKAAERHVVRKLDMRLMPTVVILFLMNYIDVSRSIVTRASVAHGSDVPLVSSVWLSLPPDFKA